MARPNLKRIEVENFKSIKDENLDLSDNSIFIGKNNSGKSNVVDVFRTVQQVVQNDDRREGWFKKRVTDQDTSKKIKLGIVFDFPDDRREELVERADPMKRRRRKHLNSIESGEEFTELKVEYEITGRTRRDWESSFFVKFDNKWQKAKELNRDNIFPNLSSTRSDLTKSILTWDFVSPFRSPEDSGKARYTTELASNGSNLIPILHSLQTNNPSQFDSLCETFTEIMEGVELLSVEFTEEGGSDLTVRIDEKGLSNPLEFSDISSGTKEILVLLAQIYNAAEQADILFLEEPELHLHPGAEQDLYQAISSISGEETGVIISTHSDVFVNRADASDIIRVAKEPFTSLRSISPDQINVELRDLGYDKSDLLQSEVVVFVEGLSDKRILREFAKTAGIEPSEQGVRFVELDDINTMKRDAKSLVKLLSAFDIPHLFVADRHGEPRESVEGEIYDEMKRDDGEGWWDASLDNVFVWDAYGIEKYLLDPRAISEVVEIEKDIVRSIIDDSSDIEDKAIVLSKIYGEKYSDHESPENIYDKTRDGMEIAKEIREEDLPEDIVEFVREVSERVKVNNGK